MDSPKKLVLKGFSGYLFNRGRYICPIKQVKIKQLILLEIIMGLSLGLFILGLVIQNQWINYTYPNTTIYIGIKWIGVIIALNFLLYFTQTEKKESMYDKHYIASIALFILAALNGISTFNPVSDESLFLQSLGNLFGGSLLILASLPKIEKNINLVKNLLLVCMIPLICLIMTLLSPDSISSFNNYIDFQKSSTAVNLCAGLSLLICSFVFLTDYYSSDKLKSLLLGAAVALSGVSCGVIAFSYPWGPAWWMSSITWLAAYLLIAAVTILYYYGHTTQNLKLLNREISDLKEMLIKSREWNLMIINAAHEPFLSFDENSNVIDWNSQAENIFEYSREEAIGKKITNLVIPAKLRDIFEQNITSYISLNKGIFFNKQIEFTIMTKKGQEFPAKLFIKPVNFMNRTFFIVFFNDAYKHKKEISNLNAGIMNDEYKMHNVEIMTRIYSTNGICTYASSNLNNLIGYLPEELIGQNTEAICYVDDIEKYQNAFSKILNSPELSKITYRIKRKDANYNWVEETFQMLPGSDNSQRQIISTSLVLGLALSRPNKLHLSA